MRSEVGRVVEMESAAMGWDGYGVGFHPLGHVQPVDLGVSTAAFKVSFAKIPSTELFMERRALARASRQETEERLYAVHRCPALPDPVRRAGVSTRSAPKSRARPSSSRSKSHARPSSSRSKSRARPSSSR
jgi:hypothetical protein